MSAKFTGQRYQFVAKREIPTGSYVGIKGPWDTYGAVTSSASHPDGFLHQVRGVSPRPGEKTVANF